MASTQKSARMFVIGVAVDFGEASGYAFDQAARIARRIPACMLQIIYVAKADADANAISKAGTDLRMYMVEKATALGGLHGQSAGVHVRSGDPAREIVQFAADVGADMLILGTHKAPDLKSLFVGSVAEKVVASASCPVVVAGPKPPDPTFAPAIEPACPLCLEVRDTTRGKTWWCERHAQHHVHAHVYSYQSQLPFAEHGSEFIPTNSLVSSDHLPR